MRLFFLLPIFALLCHGGAEEPRRPEGSCDADDGGPECGAAAGNEATDETGYPASRLKPGTYYTGLVGATANTEDVYLRVHIITETLGRWRLTRDSADETANQHFAITYVSRAGSTIRGDKITLDDGQTQFVGTKDVDGSFRGKILHQGKKSGNFVFILNESEAVWFPTPPPLHDEDDDF
eukprot:gnl/TRDRNA2_/TRDRNA2_98236_c0_seq1.p1 gnl/TRDRNA2_/TRDRNA2_98236_c0~~gnl/TRDRNA2_/TRDRNA2_98236_c0_seq1.p1  ORF type:complete len:180 (-),score=28.84 gnl/TRDRNA2_/TRDRNA2_98236_c0_seq1:36-575(-)